MWKTNLKIISIFIYIYIIFIYIRMVRWLRWHCPPDTGFEIRALAVWGRARYLSVTEAPHNTDFHTWMGKKHFCFFQTAETGNRTPDSGVKGSGANHYPRAPARPDMIQNALDVDPVFVHCWASVADVGPTLNKHWPTSRVCCTSILCHYECCVFASRGVIFRFRRGGYDDDTTVKADEWWITPCPHTGSGHPGSASLCWPLILW